MPSSNVTAPDILDRVDKVILKSGKQWAKGEFARNNAGRPVWEGASDAETFCVLGACKRAALDLGVPVGGDRGTLLYYQIRRALRTCVAEATGHDDLTRVSIPGYNDADDTTFRQIKKVIRCARDKTAKRPGE